MGEAGGKGKGGESEDLLLHASGLGRSGEKRKKERILPGGRKGGKRKRETIPHRCRQLSQKKWGFRKGEGKRDERGCCFSFCSPGKSERGLREGGKKREGHGPAITTMGGEERGVRGGPIGEMGEGGGRVKNPRFLNPSISLDWPKGKGRPGRHLFRKER